MDNDLVPVPSIINIICQALARSQQKYPNVLVLWLEANINHFHWGLLVNEGDPNVISLFLQYFNSLVAFELNELHGNRGSIFGQRARLEPIINPARMEEKLIYAVTNVVKDLQVASVTERAFFSTFGYRAQGKKLESFYIDRDKFWQKGGPHNKKHRYKEYLRFTEAHLPPLPGWEELTEEQQRTKFKKIVEKHEDNLAEERRAEGHTVHGIGRLRQLDPFDRPNNPRPKSQQPIAHALTREELKEYQKEYRQVMRDHAVASLAYRQGFVDVVFPPGTFRPPVIKPLDTS